MFLPVPTRACNRRADDGVRSLADNVPTLVQLVTEETLGESFPVKGQGDKDEPRTSTSSEKIRWPSFGLILSGYTTAEGSAGMRSAGYTGLWSRTNKACWSME